MGMAEDEGGEKMGGRRGRGRKESKKLSWVVVDCRLNCRDVLVSCRDLRVTLYFWWDSGFW